MPRTRELRHVVILMRPEARAEQECERRICKGMGVGLIWIDLSSQIPRILDAIPTATARDWDSEDADA